MHDQIDFSIDGLSSGLRCTSSRWRSRAVADGIMPVNPVPATVYTHCRSKRLTVLSDDAQATLEKWLFSDLSLNNAGIILALYTGMRLGEVCAVRWKDYDAASGTLHITQTVRRVTIDPSAESGKRTKLVFSTAKTEASERSLYLPERSLYLPEVLQGLLTVQWERFRSLFERAPDGADFIIYSAVGGVLDPDHLSAYWRDVLDGLKLPHVRFHGQVIIGRNWKVSVNTRSCTNLVLIFKATPHNWTRAISAKRRSFHCAVLP